MPSQNHDVPSHSRQDGNAPPPRSAGFTAASLVVLGALLCGARAAEDDGATAGRADLSLPATTGEVVSPHGGDVPAPSTAFERETGVEWFVVWDRALDTPRLLFPRGQYRLDADPGGTGSLLDIARASIARHAELFGVGAVRLDRLEARPIGDEVLVLGIQVHEGIPVRGSDFRMRLRADLSVRYIRCRLARALPPLDAAALGIEEALELALEDGIEPLGGATLQVAFPGGTGSARAAWGVRGVDHSGAETTERELLYDAATGERLASLETTLHFDVEGTVVGNFPRPDDIYAMPFQVTADGIYPVAEVKVTSTVTRIEDGHEFREGPVWTDADGTFRMQVGGDEPADPAIFFGDTYRLRACLNGMLFKVQAAGEACWEWSPPFATTSPTIRLNHDLGEHESFQLMAAHHVWKGQEATDDVLRAVGLPSIQETEPIANLEPGVFPLQIVAQNDTYRSSYLPGIRKALLSSDEFLPIDPETGRWRKVVPTAIYHEYAHHLLTMLTGGYRDADAHEGVSDALACFIARAGTLGFVDPETPAADFDNAPRGAHRDLGGDEEVWPDDPRRALAGALWDVWEATPDPLEPGDPSAPHSTFAYGLTLRWLASRVVLDPHLGGLSAELSPFTGVELLLEADHPVFQGDGDPFTGVPNQEIVEEAFGRRKLFVASFIRGDADGGGEVDMTDALAVLGFLFLGGAAPACPDAFDIDDSGAIELTDAVYLLGHLFQGRPPPPAPYPGCGWELVVTESLGCWRSSCGPFPWWFHRNESP